MLEIVVILHQAYCETSLQGQAGVEGAKTEKQSCFELYSYISITQCHKCIHSLGLSYMVICVLSEVINDVFRGYSLYLVFNPMSYFTVLSLASFCFEFYSSKLSIVIQ